MFALSAGAASANQAWVWACHGPNADTPLATPMEPSHTLDGAATFDCGGSDNTGATLSLTGANPAGNSNAQVKIQLPPSTKVSKVRLFHATKGSAAGARYTVTLDGGGVLVDQALDSPVGTLPSSEITTQGSGTLTFTLSCKQSDPCAQGQTPVSVDVLKVAALVDDTKAPYGSVGRNSPTNVFTQMVASAIEEGVGFGHVDAMIATSPSDAAVVRSRSVDIGTCADMTPNDPTLDLPLDPTRCETGSQSASFVSKMVKDENGKDVEVVGTSLDTSGLPEGTYYRRVVVYDAAGNGQDLLKSGTSVWEPFEVWHPVLGSPSQTLSIGSSSITNPTPNPSVNPSANGTPGNQSSSCRSPRLSVSLGQKPLRVSKSVAVLQYGKRYRFEGRLSCVVNGRRISAPKRTKIELLNKVGKKTTAKTGPKIADKGRFKISLKYPVGSRTLIFRFRNADGQRSQVSIKIKTEKKKKSTKR